jgi:hypothetical protein
MVDVQDGDAHLHKRTAIPQLLNPVSTSPTKPQEEQGFSTYRGALQRPSTDPAPRSTLSRPDLTPTSQPTFGLRAANWEPADSSPSTASTTHYASSPDTNGSVRARSASYPTYDSVQRPNDRGGYILATSFPQYLCHPQSASSSSSPAPHSLQQQPFFLYHDGRAGKRFNNLELSYHLSTL